VQKLMAAAGPMKIMAARGMAPLRPAELLQAIYQLSFDADPTVRAASEASAAGLPDKIVSPGLAEPLPAPVLHFFAMKLPAARSEALEKILYNHGTADETFVLLAGRLQDRELQIIFENEARILRYPAILEALYGNPEARMSSVNRAIELCARNGVRVEGIPSFDEVAKSITEDPEAKTASSDGAFAGALASAEQAAARGHPADADLDGERDGERDGDVDAPPPPDGEPASGGKRKSMVIDFTRLKLYEKIRLATLGNEYCRQNLMRDPNRMVAMAAVRSPRITDAEIVKAAGNRSVCEDVIRYIANQRDLTKAYPVKLSLVQNPKCPVALSMKFLPLLQGDDLKQLARSKNVPSALSTAARRLMQTRKPGQ
jgi:hypothetical protein